MDFQSFEPPKEQVAWTEEIEYTGSEFALSSVPISYFLTNVRLPALKDLFSLVEDIPGSSRWGYDAIFQRDIDDDRVEKELLHKYLLRQNKFKFFNPLTIALLPWDAKNGEIRSQYLPVETDKAAQINGSMITKLLVGGVELQELTGATIGKIRWDRNEIKGVAIDGQHRLSALMKYETHPERPLGIDPRDVRIPVTLLVFDAAASNVLAQVREIFVDINRNAEPVSTSRRILLDDRDPYAVFTRDLISDKQEVEGLPYEVVDWKRETPRPEGENQLTTTVVLYEVVKRILSTGAGSPPAKLATALDLNTELSRRKMTLIPIDNADFSFGDMNEKQIEVAKERFRAKHKKFVLSVFQNLPEYKHFLDLVSSYVDKGNEESELLREYIFKPTKKRAAVVEDIRMRGYDPKAIIDAPFEALTKAKRAATGAELLFYSVGQQALFYDLPKIRKLYSECGYESLEETAEQYIKDLGLLTSNGFFAKKMSVRPVANSKPLEIWQRICMKDDRVAPGQASVRRMSHLIVLVLCALRHGITEDFDQGPVNLRTNVKQVEDEYKKEWNDRVETAQYLSEDYNGHDDDDEDLPGDDLASGNAEKLATDTIVQILQLTRSWQPSLT